MTAKNNPTTNTPDHKLVITREFDAPRELVCWTSDAQPWDHLNPVLPRFEKYPPS